MSAHHHDGLYTYSSLYYRIRNSFFWLQASKDKNTMSATFSEVNTCFLCFTMDELKHAPNFFHIHTDTIITALTENFWLQIFMNLEVLNSTKHEIWASKEVRPPDLQTIIPSIFPQQASCFFNYSPNHVNRGKKLCLEYLETPSFLV
jgi:hypothetical protein